MLGLFCHKKFELNSLYYYPTSRENISIRNNLIILGIVPLYKKRYLGQEMINAVKVNEINETYQLQNNFK